MFSPIQVNFCSMVLYISFPYMKYIFFPPFRLTHKAIPTAPIKNNTPFDEATPVVFSQLPSFKLSHPPIVSTFDQRYTRQSAPWQLQDDPYRGSAMFSSNNRQRAYTITFFLNSENPFNPLVLEFSFLITAISAFLFLP